MRKYELHKYVKKLKGCNFSSSETGKLTDRLHYYSTCISVYVLMAIHASTAPVAKNVYIEFKSKYVGF